MSFKLPNGYESKTTFWSDFTIADTFGLNAIQDTYNRAFKEWKDNVEYLTELVIVLNHKIWEWYKTNEEIAQLYDKLWKETDAYACENLYGEDATYFFKWTD